jgi:hypothetical protein
VDAGLPHPIWSRITGWRRIHYGFAQPPDEEEAWWLEFVRVWLGRVAQSLGGTYRVVESKGFQLLTNLSDREAAACLKEFEFRHTRLCALLGPRVAARGTAINRLNGKSVVLHFEKRRDFEAFHSHSSPVGEQAPAGGVFYRRGYSHMAFYGCVDTIMPTFSHEYTHAQLCLLSLPVWLEEGVAQHMEAALEDDHMWLEKSDLRELQDCLRIWNADNIQTFWANRGFSDAELQMASYRLADALFQTIVTCLKPSSTALQNLLLASDYDDAGAYALKTHLGVTLGELTANVLGPGDWEPKKPQDTRQEPSQDPEELGYDPEEFDPPDEDGVLWQKGLSPEK